MPALVPDPRTPSGAGSEAVVRLRAGRVRGTDDGELRRFLGVPYAAAPTGDLRLAAPAPHPGWHGIRDALRHGPTPLLPPDSVTSSIPEPSVPGEEILNLDVTAPSRPGPHPVYVWVHGGSYVAGSSTGGWFDGATHARAGVVVVRVTYRLGVEGFGRIPGAPDNRGVLDLLAALAFVRDEIEAFGGDPDRVTVGGQSAGGGLVLALLASPQARGLLHGAIAHSPPLPDITPADADAVGRRFAAALGVEHDLAHWREVPREAIVAAERRADVGSIWNDLTELRRALSRGGPVTRLGPVTGTELVPEILPALAARADVPLLLGSTRHEFNPATAALEAPLGRATPRTALGVLGVPAVLARAYPRAYPGASAAALAGQALTDRVFRSTVVQVADAHPGPTHVWDFRWHPDGALARHCIDLPFAWDVLDGDRVDLIAGTDPPAALAREMSGDVVAFVHQGRAGWPAWTAAAPVGKIYDTPSWIGRDPYRFERIGTAQIGTERSSGPVPAPSSAG